jgi:predicted transposase YbfD/YdcC
VDKGHGRVERRTLTSTTALNAYLDWPGVGQVFRLVRERTTGGATTTEVAYGITSLTRAQADAGRLLTLTRDHWGIENRLHYVRDETFGEDRCRVRRGSAPQLLAAVRNVAIYLLEGVAAASKAAATRRFAAHPQEALPLILT